MIVTYPHPALLSPVNAASIHSRSLHVANFLREEFARLDRGLGLAANQIGATRGRVFIAKLGGELKTIINPTTSRCYAHEAMQVDAPEACFSLPGGVYSCRRSQCITMSWQDEDRELRANHFDGLEARIIQHEHDHLEGKLIRRFPCLQQPTNSMVVEFPDDYIPMTLPS